ncbi:putative cell division protein FtsX [Candidatus Hepatincolaceae symbiont of Richtersius coronifer]
MKNIITFPKKKLKRLLNYIKPAPNRLFNFRRLNFWNKFFVFIVACVMWLCSVSIVASNILEKLINPIKFTSPTSAIIEVYPESSTDKTQSKINVITDYLKANPAIKNYEIINEQKLKQIINTFTGDFKDQVDNIPLPIIITIELQPDQISTISDIRTHLSQKANNVYLDTEGDLLQRLASPVNTAKYFSILVPLIAITLLICILFLTIYSVLFSNKETIETLVFLGAYKGSIALEFAFWIFFKSLTACFYGLISGFLNILAFMYLFNSSFTFISFYNYFITTGMLLIILPILSSILGIVFVNKLMYKPFNKFNA